MNINSKREREYNVVVENGSTTNGKVKRIKTENGSTNNTGGTKFQPGAVLSVRMINFVTYSDMKFTLGPALNMIIGPNGTGKSTFVCAICLGFNGSPNLLGRAKELKEFVKNGESKATIIIEVQGYEGKENMVVRREFDTSNKTNWFINNRSTTAKNVDQAVKRFNIQVDNLCQFLPQDKVASFAQATPADLLLSTERAIGGYELVENHQKLKELGKQLEEHEHDGSGDAHKLEDLKRAQEEQGQLIDTIENLEEQQETLESIQLAIPMAKKKDADDKVGELRQQFEQAKQRKEELKQQNGPFINLAEESKQKAAESGNFVSNSRQVEHENERVFQKLIDQAEKYNQKYERLSNQLEELTENEDKEQKRHEALKIGVENAKKEVEKVESLYADVDQQMEQVAEKITTTKEKRAEFKNRSKENQEALIEKRDEHRTYKEKAGKVQGQVNKLKSQSDRKLTNLSKHHLEECRAAAQATRLIREWTEQGRFEKKVHIPPVLTLKMKKTDQVFLKQFSKSINLRDLLSINCESRNDYDKLSRELLDKQRLKLTIRDISKQVLKLAQIARPRVPEDQLKKEGFDGFLIDHLDGPEPVLASLCNRSFIHTIAIGSKIQAQSAQRLFESQISNDKGQLPVQLYMDENFSYQLTKSRYGAKNVQNTANRLAKPGDLTILTSESDIDHGQISELEEELKELEENMERLIAEMNPIRDEHKEFEAKYQDAAQQVNELQQKKQELGKGKGIIENKKGSLAQLEQKLARFESDKRDFEKERQELEEKIEQVADSMEPNETLQLEDTWRSLIDARVTLLKGVLGETIYNNAIGQYQRLANYGLNEIEEETERIKRDGKYYKHLSKQLEQQITQHSQEEQQKAEEQCEKVEYNLEELKNVEARVSQAITTLQEDMPDAVRIRREYEQRKLEIEEIQSRVDNHNNQLEEMKGEIERIRSAWEPELESLLEKVSNKFSQAFADIGCKGEVRLERHVDYGKWAVKIMVSFRENTDLQELTGQRQSGGERAVSTILYLMSLQELAKSPFRVVDEINQGMDPHNERMVHNRMVSVACDESTSQYFLITPKLLTNLNYDPRMKISCIYSGRDVAKLPNDKVITASSTLQALMNR